MLTVKKAISIISVLSAGGMLLTGCGSGSGSGSSPTHVTVWTWRSQDQVMWKQVQDQLNKKGENVQIDFRPVQPTSYDSVLQTAMDGGNGPDIFYTRAGEGTLKYAAADMLKPLDGMVDFSTINNKASIESAQYQGKTYGVPFAIQTMSIFYNKDIFAKYNLQEPKTWDDFIKICQTLKQNGVTPIDTMGIQGWMLSLNFDEVGASFMSNDFTKQLVDKKAKYTDEPYVNALAHYQQLADYFEPNFKAVGSAGNEQETDFALGKSAMVMDGIFDVPTIQKDNPNMKMGSFLVPTPDGSTPKVEWYVDGNISMNNSIKDPKVEKAAEDIVKYTATSEFGQDFSNIAGEISPISGVKLPDKYPLSIQAYQWYQNNAIQPVFGIRSPMDNPPPVPVNSKDQKAVNDDNGIFSAEQAVLLPLLTKQLTPEAAAEKIQNQVSWYFK